MKGYFSQLARRSGLSLETERTPDAVSARDQTPRAHAQNASAPADLIVRIVALERPVTLSDDALLSAAREPTER